MRRRKNHLEPDPSLMQRDCQATDVAIDIDGEGCARFICTHRASESALKEKLLNIPPRQESFELVLGWVKDQIARDVPKDPMSLPWCP
jgi:hypothetical protein